MPLATRHFPGPRSRATKRAAVVNRAGVLQGLGPFVTMSSRAGLPLPVHIPSSWRRPALFAFGPRPFSWYAVCGGGGAEKYTTVARLLSNRPHCRARCQPLPRICGLAFLMLCSPPVRCPKTAHGLPQLVGNTIPRRTWIFSSTPHPVWTGAIHQFIVDSSAAARVPSAGVGPPTHLGGGPSTEAPPWPLWAGGLSRSLVVAPRPC
jgi:hypothetical protein